MMFDVSHGYIRWVTVDIKNVTGENCYRKEDAVKLELVHIAKLDKNGTRFFYQKKKFQLPQYVPQSLSGYVMYGFEEIAQVSSDWLIDDFSLVNTTKNTFLF